jgi:predicted phosphate transport protein (TIGR00153 family)
MLLVKFFPREFNFFDAFDDHAGFAVEAAVFFKELVTKGEVDELALGRMQTIEHQADEATHIIIDQLNKTFITPFDREDIHALAKELDDIVDTVATIVNRMKVYKVSGPNKNLIEFANVIEQSVRAVADAVKGLRHVKNSKAISKCCVEINTLENVGDSMRDKVLAELFETEKDPIKVIKWKEIYENAETILDICEDVANVVESIVVKQA